MPHASCLKIVGDLLTNHGGADKLAVLEMAALCNEALGHKPEASALWQAVWTRVPGAARAVRLAGLQFELGKFDDAEKTITAGLAASDASTATIQLPKTREQMQQIPAAAALHNLKALVLIKRDPAAKGAAHAELEAALKLAPDYEIAKRNLKGLETPVSAEP